MAHQSREKPGVRKERNQGSSGGMWQGQDPWVVSVGCRSLSAQSSGSFKIEPDWTSVCHVLPSWPAEWSGTLIDTPSGPSQEMRVDNFPKET